MATLTSADKSKTDEFGIERAHQDDPGVIDRYRRRWGWFDHLMRMQERYGQMGGNQYSAGITYFSVLAIFPILMLVFAALGFILAANPERLTDLQQYISDHLEGQIGEMINDIVTTAIEQRGTVAGIGALTILWSGLGWMNNLRYGVSKMWRLDPTEGNFLLNKVKDLIALIVLLLAFAVAFGITAVGSSGLTETLLGYIGVADATGIRTLALIVAVVLGVLANFLVMAWLVIYLPRTRVPRRSGLQAALLGAIGFEVVKQLFSVFASTALSNPAGVTFGPIIGLMVVMYLIWRILLYVSAWAATTQESLEAAVVDVPQPAIIRVRNEVKPEGLSTPGALGIGAVMGAAAASLIRWRR